MYTLFRLVISNFGDVMKSSVGRPKTGSHKIHLTLPKEVGDWVKEMVDDNPYCQTRQDFIVGALTEKMQSGSKKQMEFELDQVA